MHMPERGQTRTAYPSIWAILGRSPLMDMPTVLRPLERDYYAQAVERERQRPDRFTPDQLLVIYDRLETGLGRLSTIKATVALLATIPEVLGANKGEIASSVLDRTSHLIGEGLIKQIIKYPRFDEIKVTDTGKMYLRERDLHATALLPERNEMLEAAITTQLQQRAV